MITKKKILVVLTNAYPYGHGETFLDDEVEYYSRFDEVYIVASIESDIQRVFLDDRYVVDCAGKKMTTLQRFGWSMRALLREETWNEIFIAPKKRTSLTSILRMAAYGERLAHRVVRVVNWDVEASYVLYSYWLMDPAYAGCLISKLCKKWEIETAVVSRAHGFDLYPSRHPHSYIPFRPFLFKGISRIFPVSKNGEETLLSHYGNMLIDENICVRHLGVKNSVVPEIQETRDPFVIVSCSSVISLKRIDKIIEALSIIDSRSITWYHIGAGPLLEEVKKTAQSELPDNIQWRFLGQVSHGQILDHYRCWKPSVFINVSENEGVPVSMMEALSCGIPIIATDVGGVSDLVIPGKTGYLLAKDFTVQDLKECVVKVSCLPGEEYLALRASSRRAWEQCFSSEINYTDLVSELYALLP